jgi:DNA-binding transcriptional LysR family regulator
MRAFIAVATERNFTRAADRLCMSQPALSRAIAQLEHLLGERLVDRTHQTVTLTTAGGRLLPHARLVVASLQYAVSAARGEASRIRLGFTWDSSFAELPLIVQDFEQRNAGAAVDLVRLDKPFSGLTDGCCDLEFVRDFESREGIDSTLLFREPSVVALPVDHRLGGKSVIDVADLRDELSVVVIGNLPPVDRTALVSSNAEIISVANIDEWLIAIAARRGIGVIEKSIADFHGHPQVRITALRNGPLAALHVAWLRTAQRVDSDALIQIALKLTDRRRQFRSVS